MTAFRIEIYEYKTDFIFNDGTGNRSIPVLQPFLYIHLVLTVFDEPILELVLTGIQSDAAQPYHQTSTSTTLSITHSLTLSFLDIAMDSKS